MVILISARWSALYPRVPPSPTQLIFLHGIFRMLTRRIRETENQSGLVLRSSPLPQDVAKQTKVQFQ